MRGRPPLHAKPGACPPPTPPEGEPLPPPMPARAPVPRPPGSRLVARARMMALGPSPPPCPRGTARGEQRQAGM
eukprot:5300019-Lingulodinium_polyedra.AAC.1